MTWDEFKSKHAFCSVVESLDGKVTEEQITLIGRLCNDPEVEWEISPLKTQFWIGGPQDKVVEFLDRLNSVPIHD